MLPQANAQPVLLPGNAGPQPGPMGGGFPGALAGMKNNPMFAQFAQMLANPQGREQVIGQLAQMGPPPQVPMATAPAPGVGPALTGMSQGLMRPRLPVMRGEAETNPPSIGGAMMGRY